MRLALVAMAMLILMPALSRAREKPAADTTNFQSLVTRIASDPAVAGEWAILLPEIARQCDMAIDHERVAAVVNAFASPEAVDEAADYFASRPESELKAAWDVIAKRDQDGACRLADGYWGNAGTLSPGVLLDTAEAPGRMISQHGIGGGTR